MISTPVPSPTTSSTCQMPDCLPFKDEGSKDAILAGAIALLLIALVLGLKKKRD